MRTNQHAEGRQASLHPWILHLTPVSPHYPLPSFRFSRTAPRNSPLPWTVLRFFLGAIGGLPIGGLPIPATKARSSLLPTRRPPTINASTSRSSLAKIAWSSGDELFGSKLSTKFRTHLELISIKFAYILLRIIDTAASRAVPSCESPVAPPQNRRR